MDTQNDGGPFGVPLTATITGCRGVQKADTATPKTHHPPTHTSSLGLDLSSPKCFWGPEKGCELCNYWEGEGFRDWPGSRIKRAGHAINPDVSMNADGEHIKTHKSYIGMSSLVIFGDSLLIRSKEIRSKDSR